MVLLSYIYKYCRRALTFYQDPLKLTCAPTSFMTKLDLNVKMVKPFKLFEIFKESMVHAKKDNKLKLFFAAIRHQITH